MSKQLLDGYLRAMILEQEIDILTARLLPEDSGHLHTTIGVLKQRIVEILGDDSYDRDEREAG